MMEYQVGYDYYKEACLQYGLEPINFAFYLLSLSKQQLDAYNERAVLKRGLDFGNWCGFRKRPITTLLEGISGEVVFK